MLNAKLRLTSFMPVYLGLPLAIISIVTPIGSTAAIAATPPLKQIDSVPAEYRPTAGAGYPEPVSMQDFYFAVDKHTGRARLVVEYGYPDLTNFGREGGAGPRATTAELSGLKLDSANQTVVFEDGSHKTLCGRVKERRLLFWKHEWVASTGACEVTAQVAEHPSDNQTPSNQRLDTYLRIR